MSRYSFRDKCSRKCFLGRKDLDPRPKNIFWSTLLIWDVVLILVLSGCDFHFDLSSLHNFFGNLYEAKSRPAPPAEGEQESTSSAAKNAKENAELLREMLQV